MNQKYHDLKPMPLRPTVQCAAFKRLESANYFNLRHFSYRNSDRLPRRNAKSILSLFCLKRSPLVCPFVSCYFIPAFSCPTISCPANWSVNFTSVIFTSRIFSAPIFTSSIFSQPPLDNGLVAY